jgi:hypothetical protein
MSRLTIRLRRLYADADYAQRRLLELRTGLTLTGPRAVAPRARREIDHLEAALAAPPALNLRGAGTI